MAKYLQRLCAAFAIVALLVVTGCASQTAGTSASAGGNPQSSASSKTLTDAYGRSVSVPADAKSAATVGSGARIVVYAGAQDKLIAVTDMETDPGMNRPYAMAFADFFKGLPSTSNGNHLVETNVNTEELLRLGPDVIVSSRSAEECDDLQQKTGIPVVGVSYQNQLFSEDVYNSIQCVAQALGTEAHGNEVVAKLKEWQQDLQNRTKPQANPQDAEVMQPTVYIGALNYKGAKGWTGTSANYAPAKAVNVHNVADETDQKSAFDIDLEQLAIWDPDYMFLNAANYDLLKTGYSENEDFFNSLLAFKAGHLYTQPTYNFNGTNIGTGVCDAYFIGATVYPDAFADLDLSAKYTEIYKTLLGGFDYYKLMTDKGMNFGPFPAL